MVTNMEKVKKQEMESLFVGYEQALALKELGFDEPCFAKFVKGHFSMNTLGRAYKHNSGEIKASWVSAPTYSQAFRFFREKYKLSGEVGSHQFYFMHQIIYDTLGVNTCKAIEYNFESHEEAELACLRKLIEIVKQS